MKMNKWKRVLTLVLALVLVVGMVPHFAVEADAVDVNYNYGFTFRHYATRCNNCNAYDISLKITSISLVNKTLTVSYRVTCNSCGTPKDYTATDSSFDCTKKYDWKYLSSNFYFYREAGHTNSQTTAATCTTAGSVTWTNCGLCGTSGSNTLPIDANAHKWGEWKSNSNNTHSRICDYNNAHKETEDCSGDAEANCNTSGTCTTCDGSYKDTDNHSPASAWTTANGKHYHVCNNGCETKFDEGNCTYSDATCLAASVCSTCNYTYEAQKGHNYTYTASGSTITETCNNGCNHSVTATLQVKSGANLTYTGQPIEPCEIVYPEGWVGTQVQPTANDYTNNVDAGRAVCTIAYANNGTAVQSFDITEATMTVAASGYSSTYDGQPHGITVNAPEGATIKYGTEEGAYTLEESPTLTDVGSTTVYYEVTKANHETVTGSQTITITPATITVTPDSGKSITYGEEMPELTYTVSGKVGSEIPGFTGALAIDSTNAGSYKIKQGTLALVDNDNFKVSNYTLTVDETVDFTVNAADGSASVSIEDWTYGESAKAPVPVSVTNGVGNVTYLYKKQGAQDSTYDDDVPTEAGYYTVKATFATTNNYKAVAATADFEIKKADPKIGTVSAKTVENTLETSAIRLERTNTAVDGELTVDADQTLAWGENEIDYTFTPDDTNNYEIVTRKVKVTVVDTIAPTGTIEVKDSGAETGNIWRSWSNAIIRFFTNKDQTVTITADDEMSGVKSIEYYESATALTQEDITAVTGWKEGSSVNVTVEDTKQFIYYARIADNAGNITYLASDGTEFDTTAPKITGVEDGGAYYVTTGITVTDKNPESVTVNGEPVTEPITLAGNVDAEYTIVAKDKAGNETTVKVTMKPISTLSQPIDELTEENVTSADQQTVEDVRESVAEQDTTNATEEEKEALEAISDKTDELEQAVEDAAKALETESTGKTANVTADNVTLENKTDLEKAKEALEKALEDNGGNYTEEEKKAIQDEIDRIEAAIEAVKNAEDVQALLNTLPAAALPDDKEAIAAAEKASAAYGALTKHEKTLVKTDKLNALLNSLSAYKLTAGDGGSWKQGSGADLSFTANGAYSKFAGITVDGKKVDAKYYTAVSGSTIVTLKAEYLETLTAGEHDIAVVYPDGAAEGTFTVVKKAATPSTGDESLVFMWLGLFLVSGTAAAALVVSQKKKRSI